MRRYPLLHRVGDAVFRVELLFGVHLATQCYRLTMQALGARVVARGGEPAGLVGEAVRLVQPAVPHSSGSSRHRLRPNP